MNLDFNRELAIKNMTLLLTKTKYGYIQRDANDKRIESIDEILSNKTLLEKLVDIKLTDDILSIIVSFNLKKAGTQTSTYGQNLLLSSVSKGVTIISRVGLLIDGKLQKFYTSEELRQYLYNLVGFAYQTLEQGYKESDESVVDPLAKSGFELPNTIYNLLDDIDAINKYKTPKRIDNALGTNLDLQMEMADSEDYDRSHHNNR